MTSTEDTHLLAVAMEESLELDTDSPRLSTDSPRLHADTPRLRADSPRLQAESPQLQADFSRLSVVDDASALLAAEGEDSEALGAMETEINFYKNANKELQKQLKVSQQAVKKSTEKFYDNNYKNLSQDMKRQAATRFWLIEKQNALKKEILKLQNKAQKLKKIVGKDYDAVECSMKRKKVQFQLATTKLKVKKMEQANLFKDGRIKELEQEVENLRGRLGLS